MSTESGLCIHKEISENCLARTAGIKLMCKKDKIWVVLKGRGSSSEYFFQGEDYVWIIKDKNVIIEDIKWCTWSLI